MSRIADSLAPTSMLLRRRQMAIAEIAQRQEFVSHLESALAERTGHGRRPGKPEYVCLCGESFPGYPSDQARLLNAHIENSWTAEGVGNESRA